MGGRIPGAAEAASGVREVERVLALREARTSALARRDREQGGGRQAGPVPSTLVCTCGGERYALPMAAVAQVLPSRACTPIPGAPPALRGIVALSGAIVSVLDLARALGREAGQPAQDGHLVVLRGAPPIALAVDRVLGVAQLAGPDGSETPADPAGPAFGGMGSEAVSGYGPAERGAAGVGDFVVIDLPRLLRRYLP
ncbi:chemotaxis protein CheW [Methylobacterium soli]|uniref:chemotaxis protein CheW n=1 Tax=Methylobacterium soli TaxID=553447 RepID=UPI001EE2DF10|nr:chemotaxis protein CheW [Methylobacterium soli]GJE41600.1 hypothetical protein AEGHOMDF_0766 [Methylobacterium soli]